MSVDIDNYCSNPSKYSTLPPNTIDYYNNLCSLRKSISTSGGNNIDWSGLGPAFGKAPVEIVNGIFSPQGLKMISIFVGVDIAAKGTMNVVLRTIAQGLDESVMEAAVAKAAESGATFVNNAILTTVLTSAVKEGTTEAIALNITKLIADAASEVMIITMIVQLLTMVLDIWDPMGFNQLMDGTNMTNQVTEMNNAFIKQFLNTFTVGTDEFGNPINIVTWPVEYYADNLISGEKQSVYQPKYFLYISEYLSNLTVNSEGNPIVWPKDTSGPLLKPSHFDQLASRFSTIIANKNSVIANWIDRFLPIIIAVFIIGIIIFVFLIK